MNTLRRYVWREVAASTGFVLLAIDLPTRWRSWRC
jgi:hypothetical protein